jgi:hypothetical protein
VLILAMSVSTAKLPCTVSRRRRGAWHALARLVSALTERETRTLGARALEGHRQGWGPHVLRDSLENRLFLGWSVEQASMSGRAVKRYT